MFLFQSLFCCGYVALGGRGKGLGLPKVIGPGALGSQFLFQIS